MNRDQVDLGSDVAWTQRRVHAIAGLPFDAVSMDDAIALVRQAIASRQRLFLTTPNTNFVTLAQRDAAFRESVLRSDLCLADGMPIVWMARLLAVPLPERVSGADLFEALLTEPGPPLSVYFFGGPDGAAKSACSEVNAHNGPMRCAGHCSPGYLPVDALSQDQYIDAINASGADMLVVSLGAQKGQEWIMRNRARLSVPVLTHLGAVVNFTARRVKRAPKWMRSSGVEWAWRIGQEPALWRRYARDAISLVRIGAISVTPLLLQRWALLRPAKQDSLCLVTRDEALGVCTVRPTDWTPLGLLRLTLAEAARHKDAVELDASRLSRVSAATVGLLLTARQHLHGVRIVRAPRAVEWSLHWHGAGELLNPEQSQQTGDEQQPA